MLNCSDTTNPWLANELINCSETPLLTQRTTSSSKHVP